MKAEILISKLVENRVGLRIVRSALSRALPSAAMMDVVSATSVLVTGVGKKEIVSAVDYVNTRGYAADYEWDKRYKAWLVFW